MSSVGCWGTAGGCVDMFRSGVDSGAAADGPATLARSLSDRLSGGLEA